MRDIAGMMVHHQTTAQNFAFSPKKPHGMTVDIRRKKFFPPCGRTQKVAEKPHSFTTPRHVAACVSATEVRQRPHCLPGPSSPAYWGSRSKHRIFYECVPPFTHTVTQLCEGLAL